VIAVRTLLRRLALGAAVVVAAACGADGDDASAPTTTAEVPAATIEWTSVGTVGLGGGWSLTDAAGDAALVAILRNGVEVGILELYAYPVSSLDAVEAHLDEGEDAALTAHVDDFVTAMATDRAIGCDPAYEVVPTDAVHMEVGDGRAVRYGFTGAMPAGAVTERSLQWAAIRGEALVLVNVAAYDDGSCIPTDGAELSVSELAAVEARLAAAVESSDFGEVVEVTGVPPVVG
jgi:hypothetical protein